MGDLGGYRGPSLKILQDVGAEIGDVLELELDGDLVKGTVVPRYQSNDDSHVVIKLKSGYNVGISLAKISSVKKVSAGEKPSFASSGSQTAGRPPRGRHTRDGGHHRQQGRLSHGRRPSCHLGRGPLLSHARALGSRADLSRDGRHRLQRESGAVALGQDSGEGRRVSLEGEPAAWSSRRVRTSWVTRVPR